MSGKLDNGVYEQTADVLLSKAFCEGMQYRTQGTAVAYPITGCPHLAADAEAYASWRAGWTVANGAAGGALTESEASCCALVGTAVSA